MCLVAHWPREALEDTAYGDHRSPGLPDGRYGILREAVDATRPVRESQGARAALKVIGRQLREAGTERYRTGAPVPDPWR